MRPVLPQITGVRKPNLIGPEATGRLATDQGSRARLHELPPIDIPFAWGDLAAGDGQLGYQDRLAFVALLKHRVVRFAILVPQTKLGAQAKVFAR